MSFQSGDCRSFVKAYDPKDRIIPKLGAGHCYMYKTTEKGRKVHAATSFTNSWRSRANG
jgi:hypothetical protein